MTNSRKNADQLVQDLINGEFSALSTGSMEDTMTAVKNKVENEYDVDDNSLKAALKARSADLESAIGMSLTDDQLEGLTGGKSAGKTAEQVGIGAGAGIGGALGVVVAIGVASAFFK